MYYFRKDSHNHVGSFSKWNAGNVQYPISDSDIIVNKLLPNVSLLLKDNFFF